MQDIETVYPAGTDPATAELPFGVPLDVTAPGAGDGFPNDSGWLKDLFAMMWLFLDKAGVTPSGTPDGVKTSDYDDAFRQVVPTYNSRYEFNHIHGLRMGWIAGGSDFTIGIGGCASARSPQGYLGAVELSDINFPVSFQKDVTAVWVQGDAVGCRPVGITLATNTWYGVWMVARPLDGVADFTIAVEGDLVSPVAFFADPASASAGFTDTAYCRRVGWIRTNSGPLITQFVTDLQNPREFLWTTPAIVIAGSAVSNILRANQPMQGGAPPNSLVTLVIRIDGTALAVGAHQVAITTTGQVDNAPSLTVFTLALDNVHAGASDVVAVIRDRWAIEADQNIWLRSSALGMTTTILADGYRDDALLTP